MKIFHTIRLALGGKKYRIALKKTKSKSNYNVFVAVYEIGDRLAITGTTFKETDTKSIVKEWAVGAIKRYSKESVLSLW